MQILVTGGGGFLGSAVVRHLLAAGHSVAAPRSVIYDLRKSGHIALVLADTRPEVVVHLAAIVGGIGANEAAPGRFLYENAIMGLELMEQARTAAVRKFVTIGTACEYPAHAPQPLQETSIWDGYPAEPTAPYGLAKRLLLAQGQAYRREYGFNAIHLIPTNLYGPGDNFDPEMGHAVPGMIKKLCDATLRHEASVTLWGTGEPTRDFCYVEDAVRAILLATEDYDEAEPVNIGTGVETSISELASTIAELLGYAGEIVWDAAKPDGTARRWMDISRAEAGFGFRAMTPLHEGLRRTIEWYVNA